MNCTSLYPLNFIQNILLLPGEEGALLIIDPCNPHDAAKFHFASLKIDLFSTPWGVWKEHFNETI